MSGRFKPWRRGLSECEAGLLLPGLLQYVAARVHFFGPVSGGFSDEHLGFNERILSAFDQSRTGTDGIFYRWSSGRIH